MSETKAYSLSNLASCLATASNIAKELGIEISQTGTWRRVIIANALNHTLTSDPDDPLLDATKDENTYAYLAAHYGKRAQLFLASSTLSKPRKNHTFIVAFFSETDSSKILSMWSCEPNVIWSDVNKQISRRHKSKKTKSQPVHFSEAWLRSKKGKGAELIFKDENI